MRNCKKELLTALISAIKTSTGLTAVRSKVNDFETLDNSFYPYIHISDIYQTEGGVKTYYNYQVELLVQIVYKDQTSLTDLYDKQNDVLGILIHPKPFELTNGFEIIETLLVTSSDTEIEIETGILNVGLIRIRFLIIDNGLSD